MMWLFGYVQEGMKMVWLIVVDYQVEDVLGSVLGPLPVLMVPGHHQKGKVRYKVKSGVEDVKPGTSYRQIFDNSPAPLI